MAQTLLTQIKELALLHAGILFLLEVWVFPNSPTFHKVIHASGSQLCDSVVAQMSPAQRQIPSMAYPAGTTVGRVCLCWHISAAYALCLLACMLAALLH